MTVGQAALLYGTGLLAGFVNTVAGGGSALTIPVLVEMVGPTLANGTNRLSVLIANSTAGFSFHRGGVVRWRLVASLAPPTLVGAGLGAWLATRTSPEAMKTIFGLVLLVVAAGVVVKPGQWLAEHTARLGGIPRLLVFLLIGFYGGLVQIGVGFFLLAALVLAGGLDLISGNAVKVVLIAFYTLAALSVFAGAAQVDVLLGVVLAAGNSTGALISSKLAMSRGTGWIRWILVVAAVGAAIRMLIF